MSAQEGHRLRVAIADDERPARAFLRSILEGYDDVEVVGEATTGSEAVALIERTNPDLAILDLQMPEVDGIGVVQLLRMTRLPLIAFVTAYDEFAVRAFEVNAVDYLLKPVEPARLRQTINRALDRMEATDAASSDAGRVSAAASLYAALTPSPVLRRIPVRRRDDIILVPTDQIVSIVADGELLRITTKAGERFIITYRLKDLESRLDATQFVRLSRGTVVSTEAIQKVTPMPGGTYVVTLAGGTQHSVSRLRARVIRDELLKL